MSASITVCGHMKVHSSSGGSVLIPVAKLNTPVDLFYVVSPIIVFLSRADASAGIGFGAASGEIPMGPTWLQTGSSKCNLQG